jgi:hypothetical protein
MDQLGRDAADDQDAGSSYRPPKLKMKLKETKLEREERRWRKEQRRLRKESGRLYRANGVSPVAGMAITPPRPTGNSREESISPPRKRIRRTTSIEGEGTFEPSRPDVGRNAYMQDWDDDVWQPQASAYKRVAEAARAVRDEQEWRQKMFDLMADEEQGPIDLTSGRYRSPPLRTARHYEPDDAGDGSPASPYIPERIRRAAGWKHDTPDYANMDEEEYSEAIRYGMWRRRNKEEVERQERAAKFKREEAEIKARLKRMQEEEEKKRIEVLKRETGKAEQRRREREMVDYATKWQILRTGRAEPDKDPSASPPLRLVEIPWPVFLGAETAAFHPTMLKPERISAFFGALHEYELGQKQEADGPTIKAPPKGDTLTLRRVLRDAILAYHPDRFIGRYLNLVHVPEQEMVREAVIRCSQIINDLANENKDK